MRRACDSPRRGGQGDRGVRQCVQQVCQFSWGAAQAQAELSRSARAGKRRANSSLNENSMCQDRKTVHQEDMQPDMDLL